MVVLFIHQKTKKMNDKEIFESEYECEFCNMAMTEEEHDFCDICGDCRES